MNSQNNFQDQEHLSSQYHNSYNNQRYGESNWNSDYAKHEDISVKNINKDLYQSYLNNTLSSLENAIYYTPDFQEKFQYLNQKHRVNSPYSRSEYFKIFNNNEYQNYTNELKSVVEQNLDPESKFERNYKWANDLQKAGSRFLNIGEYTEAKRRSEQAYDFFIPNLDELEDRGLEDHEDSLLENLSYAYEATNFVNSRIDVLISIADHLIDNKNDFERAEDFFTKAANSQIKLEGGIDLDPSEYINETSIYVEDLGVLLISLSKLATINSINLKYLHAYRFLNILNFILDITNKFNLLQAQGTNLTYQAYLLLMGEICLDSGYYKYKTYKYDEALHYYNKALSYFQTADSFVHINKANYLISQTRQKIEEKQFN